MREVLAKLAEHRELAHFIPILLAGLLGGILAGRILFGIFFRNRRHFLECLRYTYQPDWLSLWRGEFWRDVGGSLRFGIWLFVTCCAAIVAMMLSIPIIERVGAVFTH